MGSSYLYVEQWLCLPALGSGISLVTRLDLEYGPKGIVTTFHQAPTDSQPTNPPSGLIG